MKMKNLFTKLIAVTAAAVLAAGVFIPVRVQAGEIGVEKLVEYSVSKNVTVSKTVTVPSSTTAVNVKSVYPYVKVAGDPVLAKTIRKTLKSAAFTGLTAQYSKNLAAGNVFPEDSVINIEITYDAEASSRCGNIASFVFTRSAYVEGGAYPTNDTYIVNIDLTTGKKLTLSALFKNKNRIKAFLAKASKTYADTVYSSAAPLFEFSPELADEYAFFENLQLADVRNAIDIYSIKFNWDGVTLYFDETDGLWPHAFGTQEMFIPYNDITPYIKASAVQLFRPYSVEVINLEYNAGTGYSWIGGIDTEGADNCLELVYVNSYAKNPSLMLAGGRMCEVIVYMAVKEGRVDLNYRLVRPWETDGAPAQTYSRKLIVTSDLFITDDNGEY